MGSTIGKHPCRVLPCCGGSRGHSSHFSFWSAVMQISFDLVQASDPDVYAALQGEEQRQRDGIELIPSENYAFPEVYATNGSVFANKYSEGYPGRRYYGGQQFTDRIEALAVE